MSIDVAHRFSPISLAELNIDAALLRRTDRKYLLERADAEMVLATMPEGARVLTIDGRTSHEYQSVYFDTFAFDAYLLAARGRTHRFKVRTRHYLDSGEAFLEVKTREAGQTVKRRIPHDPRGLFAIHPDQFAFVTDCLVAGRVPDVRPAWLQPALQTTYRRTTLLAPDGASRVTIDDELRWQAIGAGRHEAPDLVVLETKTSGNASPIDRWLWSMGHRPGRISKYATGLAALRPELPDNRWHRTLHTWFA